MLKDSTNTPTIRAAGLHTLTQILSMTKSLPKRDQTIFEDYIFPALSTYPTDHEVIFHRHYFKYKYIYIC